MDGMETATPSLNELGMRRFGMQVVSIGRACGYPFHLSKLLKH
jgi:hypothetical protein